MFQFYCAKKILPFDLIGCNVPIVAYVYGGNYLQEYVRVFLFLNGILLTYFTLIIYGMYTQSVYKDHLMAQSNVLFIHRWSLCKHGSLYHSWDKENVVLYCRWS